MKLARYWTFATERPPGSPGGPGLGRRGWSTESADDARRHALQRLQAAIAARDDGERPPRRDPATGYNGAEEQPIFEEIVASMPDLVVTRNGYGARCLNTPNVLIADVDLPAPPPGPPRRGFTPTLAALTGVLAGAVLGNAIEGAEFSMAWPAVAGLAAGVASLVYRSATGAGLGPAGVARAALDGFVRAHPEWAVRIYATPAGFRYIATHDVFDPRSSAVSDFFDAVSADTRYAAMCARQGCFRARLTAKPWRIDLAARFGPHPDAWPPTPAEAARRQAWIDTYEPMAARAAACHFVASVGSGSVCGAAQHVVDYHDAQTQAHQRDLPLA